jgi:competence protein ComEC
MMNFYSSYAFRLMIPLILGFVLADALAAEWGDAAWRGYDGATLLWGGCSAASLLLFGLLLFFLKKDTSLYKERFGATLLLLMTTLGGSLYLKEYRDTRVDWSREETAYSAYLFDRPVPKKKHLRCPVQVEGHRVLLYLPDDSLGRTLQRGDEIYFVGKVTYSDTAKYDRIYFHQGISGTAFVRPDHWQPTGRRHPLNLQQRALACRDAIVQGYRRMGIEGDGLAVLSALTVGQTDELSTEVRQDFSGAGISHVLALSGLHVGLIWAVINMCFPAYIERHSLRWMRWGIVSALLTAYVFLAGLPPSAVRAVLMCIVWEANICISTEYTPRLHSLLSVCLVMLLIRPFYLYQLSFQLSVMAVGSILAFYEPILEFCRYQFGMHARKVSFLLVPLIAQIGVAPLTLYYFHALPVYFLFTSLVAVALAEVIVYSALLSLPLSGIGGWITWLAGKWLGGWLAALTGLAGWVARLPHATWTVHHFEGYEVAAMYLLIALFYQWIRQPSLRRALYAFMAFDLELALCLFR